MSAAASPRIARSSAYRTIVRLLGLANIDVNGRDPWDIQVHDERTYARVLARGSLGLGESYMDGWWDCESLDGFFHRILLAKLDRQVTPGEKLQALRSRLFNRQSVERSRRVADDHYDLGNDFFAAMLDNHMMYTCGYWHEATTLEQAQTAKLDLICRKLGLRRGMRLLDCGCGWGGLMKFAAENYGVSCVGLNISDEQVAFCKERVEHLPIEVRLCDYRAFNTDALEKFDRVTVVGMIEHVGSKNHAALFDAVRRSMTDEGLFMLHTIGKNIRNTILDRWTERYIFPNGELPALSELTEGVEGRFIVEDVHNFGADYDLTLMAWHNRFEAAWPQYRDRYGDRFYRMWRYYLLSCAGTFRARSNQLWQVVLSPSGIPGGYRRELVADAHLDGGHSPPKQLSSVGHVVHPVPA
jgi:cyclopropane-fatty-acyl-phospholipid synthase